MSNKFPDSTGLESDNYSNSKNYDFISSVTKREKNTHFSSFNGYASAFGVSNPFNYGYLLEKLNKKGVEGEYSNYYSGVGVANTNMTTDPIYIELRKNKKINFYITDGNPWQVKLDERTKNLPKDLIDETGKSNKEVIEYLNKEAGFERAKLIGNNDNTTGHGLNEFQLHGKLFYGKTSDGQEFVRVDTGNVGTALGLFGGMGIGRTEMFYQTTNPELIAESKQYFQALAKNQEPKSGKYLYTKKTDYYKKLTDDINKSTGDITIHGASLDRNVDNVLDALIKAKNRGQNVTVLAAGARDTTLTLEYLKSKGITVTDKPKYIPGTNLPINNTGLLSPLNFITHPISKVLAGATEHYNSAVIEGIKSASGKLFNATYTGTARLEDINFTTAKGEEVLQDVIVESHLRLTSEEDPKVGQFLKKFSLSRYTTTKESKTQEYTRQGGRYRLLNPDFFSTASQSKLSFRAKFNAPYSKTPEGKFTEINFKGVMPNYSLELTDYHFRRYRGRFLPTAQTFERLYKSRVNFDEYDNNKKVNNAYNAVIDKDLKTLQDFDTRISTPTLGQFINYKFGQNTYEKGQGFIGSGLRGLGRTIDNIFGYEDYHQQKRQDKFRDPITTKTMMGLYDTPGADRPIGQFESIFNVVHGAASGFAIALSTYIGINLPIKHLFDKLEDSFADAMFTPNKGGFSAFLTGGMNKLLLGRTGNLLNIAASGKDVQSRHHVGQRFEQLQTNIEKFRTNLIADIMDKADHKVDLSNLDDPNSQAFKQQLEGMSSKEFEKAKQRALSSINDVTQDAVASQYLSSLSKNDILQSGQLMAGNASNYSIYGAQNAMRDFDAKRFDYLLAPILRGLNPYKFSNSTSSAYSVFNESIKEVGRTIGQKSLLVTGDSKLIGSTGIHYKNSGVQRTLEIAKSLDRVGALLPVNLFYWLPSLRDALKLPEFDHTKDMVWRDLFSIEESTKRVQKNIDHITKTFGLSWQSLPSDDKLRYTVLRRPVELIKTAINLVAAPISNVIGHLRLLGLNLKTEQLHKKATAEIKQTVETFNKMVTADESYYNLPNKTINNFDEATENIDNLFKEVRDFETNTSIDTLRTKEETLLNNLRKELAGKGNVVGSPNPKTGVYDPTSRGSNNVRAFLEAQEDLNNYYGKVLGQNASFAQEVIVANPLDPKVSEGHLSLTNFEKTKGGKDAVKSFKGKLKFVGGLLAFDAAFDFAFLNTGVSIFQQITARKALSRRNLNEVTGEDQGSEFWNKGIANFRFQGNTSTAWNIGFATTFATLGGVLFPQIDNMPDNKLVLGSPMTAEARRTNIANSMLDPQMLPDDFQDVKLTTDTKFGDAPEGLIKARNRLTSAVGAFNNLQLKRTSYTFNRKAAASGVILGLVAAKLGAMAIASFMSMRYNDDPNAPDLSSTSSVVSSYLEEASKRGFKEANTFGQLAVAATLSEMASRSIEVNQHSNKVYNIATQSTLPFFQLAFIGKVNSSERKITLGTAFQLNATLGLGVSPTLPFAIRLRDRAKSDTEKLAELQNENNQQSTYLGMVVDKTDAFQIAKTSLISLVTLGEQFAYEEDSDYEKAANFLGTIALAKTVGSSIRSTYRGSGLSDIGWVNREVRSLNKAYNSMPMNVLKALGPNAVKHLSLLPITLVDSTIRAVPKNPFTAVVAITTVSYFASTNLIENYLKAKSDPNAAMSSAEAAERETQTQYNKTGALLVLGLSASGVALAYQKVDPHMKKAFGAAGRRAGTIGMSLYAGIFLAKLISEPGTKFRGYSTETRDEQNEATIGIGATLGAGFLMTGVFSSEESLIREYKRRIAKQDTGDYKANYAREVQELVKEEVFENIQTKQLLGKAELGDVRGWRPFALDTDTLRDMVGERLFESYSPEVANSKTAFRPFASSRYRMMAGRANQAYLVWAATAITAGAINNFAPQNVKELLYQAPIIGASLKVLNGSGKPSEEGDDASNFITQTFNNLTFNAFNMGAYHDKSDPYLSTLGGFGLSFKEKGISSYFQLATDSSDFSASSFNLVSARLKNINRMRDMIATNGQNYLKVFEAYRGHKPRKTAMKVDRLTSASEEILQSSVGLSMALDRRYYMQRHKANQSIDDLALDLYMSGFMAGKVQSPELQAAGFTVPETMHPLDFIGKAVFSVGHPSKRMKVNEEGKYVIDPKSKSKMDPHNLQQIFDEDVYSDRLITKKGALTDYFTSIFSGISDTAIGKKEWLGAGIGMVSGGLILGVIGFSTFKGLTSIAHMGRERTAIETFEATYMSKARITGQKSRFIFKEVNIGDKKVVAQVDLASGGKSGYGLAYSDDLIARAKIRQPMGQLNIDDLLPEIQTRHSQLLQSVEELAFTTFPKQINELSTTIRNSTDSNFGITDELVSKMRTDAKREIRAKLITELSTEFKSVKGLNIGELFYDLHSKEQIEEFVENLLTRNPATGGQGFVDNIFDDMITQAKIEARAHANMGLNKAAQVARNNAQLTITSNIAKAISSSDNVNTSLLIYQLSKGNGNILNLDGNEVVTNIADDVTKHERLVAQATRRARVDASLHSGKIPWGQSFLEDTFQGASLIGGKTIGGYFNYGQPAYEFLEGGALVLDSSKSKETRRLAAQHTLSTGTTNAVGFGISVGLAKAGLHPILSLGIGLTIASVLPVLRMKNERFRNKEADIYQRLAKKAVPEQGEGIHLRGFGTQTFLRGINKFTREITGPLIAKQMLQKDSIKSGLAAFILPQTYYLNDYNQYQQKKQSYFNYIRETGAHLIKDRPDSEFVHGSLYGQAPANADPEGQARYIRYFLSRGYGGRVLSEFARGAYTPSTLLTLALSRRQGLHDQFVVGSAAGRFINQSRPKTNTAEQNKLIKEFALTTLTYGLIGYVASKIGVFQAAKYATDFTIGSVSGTVANAIFGPRFEAVRQANLILTDVADSLGLNPKESKPKVVYGGKKVKQTYYEDGKIILSHEDSLTLASRRTSKPRSKGTQGQVKFTLAHEYVHHQQFVNNQFEDKPIYKNLGDTQDPKLGKRHNEIDNARVKPDPNVKSLGSNLQTGKELYKTLKQQARSEDVEVQTRAKHIIALSQQSTMTAHNSMQAEGLKPMNKVQFEGIFYNELQANQIAYDVANQDLNPDANLNLKSSKPFIEGKGQFVNVGDRNLGMIQSDDIEGIGNNFKKMVGSLQDVSNKSGEVKPQSSPINRRYAGKKGKSGGGGEDEIMSKLFNSVLGGDGGKKTSSSKPATYNAYDIKITFSADGGTYNINSNQDSNDFSKPFYKSSQELASLSTLDTEEGKAKYNQLLTEYEQNRIFLTSENNKLKIQEFLSPSVADTAFDSNAPLEVKLKGSAGESAVDTTGFGQKIENLTKQALFQNNSVSAIPSKKSGIVFGRSLIVDQPELGGRIFISATMHKMQGDEGPVLKGRYFYFHIPDNMSDIDATGYYSQQFSRAISNRENRMGGNSTVDGGGYAYNPSQYARPVVMNDQQILDQTLRLLDTNPSASIDDPKPDTPKPDIPTNLNRPKPTEEIKAKTKTINNKYLKFNIVNNEADYNFGNRNVIDNELDSRVFYNINEPDEFQLDLSKPIKYNNLQLALEKRNLQTSYDRLNQLQIAYDNVNKSKKYKQQPVLTDPIKRAEQSLSIGKKGEEAEFLQSQINEMKHKVRSVAKEQKKLDDFRGILTNEKSILQIQEYNSGAGEKITLDKNAPRGARFVGHKGKSSLDTISGKGNIIETQVNTLLFGGGYIGDRTQKDAMTVNSKGLAFSGSMIIDQPELGGRIFVYANIHKVFDERSRGTPKGRYFYFHIPEEMSNEDAKSYFDDQYINALKSAPAADLEDGRIVYNISQTPINPSNINSPDILENARTLAKAKQPYKSPNSTVTGTLPTKIHTTSTPSPRTTTPPPPSNQKGGTTKNQNQNTGSGTNQNTNSKASTGTKGNIPQTNYPKTPTPNVPKTPTPNTTKTPVPKPKIKEIKPESPQESIKFNTPEINSTPHTKPEVVETKPSGSTGEMPTSNINNTITINSTTSEQQPTRPNDIFSGKKPILYSQNIWDESFFLSYKGDYELINGKLVALDGSDIVSATKAEFQKGSEPPSHLLNTIDNTKQHTSKKPSTELPKPELNLSAQPVVNKKTTTPPLEDLLVRSKDRRQTTQVTETKPDLNSPEQPVVNKETTSPPLKNTVQPTSPEEIVIKLGGKEYYKGHDGWLVKTDVPNTTSRSVGGPAVTIYRYEAMAKWVEEQIAQGNGDTTSVKERQGLLRYRKPLYEKAKQITQELDNILNNNLSTSTNENLPKSDQEGKVVKPQNIPLPDTTPTKPRLLTYSYKVVDGKLKGVPVSGNIILRPDGTFIDLKTGKDVSYLKRSADDSKFEVTQDATERVVITNPAEAFGDYSEYQQQQKSLGKARGVKGQLINPVQKINPNLPINDLGNDVIKQAKDLYEARFTRQTAINAKKQHKELVDKKRSLEKLITEIDNPSSTKLNRADGLTTEEKINPEDIKKNLQTTLDEVNKSLNTSNQGLTNEERKANREIIKKERVQLKQTLSTGGVDITDKQVITLANTIGKSAYEAEAEYIKSLTPVQRKAYDGLDNAQKKAFIDQNVWEHPDSQYVKINRVVSPQVKPSTDPPRSETYASKVFKGLRTALDNVKEIEDTPKLEFNITKTAAESLNYLGKVAESFNGLEDTNVTFSKVLSSGFTVFDVARHGFTTRQNRKSLAEIEQLAKSNDKATQQQAIQLLAELRAMEGSNDASSLTGLVMNRLTNSFIFTMAATLIMGNSHKLSKDVNNEYLEQAKREVQQIRDGGHITNNMLSESENLRTWKVNHMMESFFESYDPIKGVGSKVMDRVLPVLGKGVNFFADSKSGFSGGRFTAGLLIFSAATTMKGLDKLKLKEIWDSNPQLQTKYSSFDAFYGENQNHFLTAGQYLGGFTSGFELMAGTPQLIGYGFNALTGSPKIKPAAEVIEPKASGSTGADDVSKAADTASDATKVTEGLDTASDATKVKPRGFWQIIKEMIIKPPVKYYEDELDEASDATKAADGLDNTSKANVIDDAPKPKFFERIKKFFRVGNPEEAGKLKQTVHKIDINFLNDNRVSPEDVKPNILSRLKSFFRLGDTSKAAKQPHMFKPLTDFVDSVATGFMQSRTVKSITDVSQSFKFGVREALRGNIVFKGIKGLWNAPGRFFEWGANSINKVTNASVTKHGLRNTTFNSLAYIIDSTMFAFGAASMSQLNDKSSKEDFLLAYSQVGGAQGRIVGAASAARFGIVAEILGSHTAGHLKSKENQELALKRFEQNDTSNLFLRDAAVPLTRELKSNIQTGKVLKNIYWDYAALKIGRKVLKHVPHTGFGKAIHQLNALRTARQVKDTAEAIETTGTVATTTTQVAKTVAPLSKWSKVSLGLGFAVDTALYGTGVYLTNQAQKNRETNAEAAKTQFIEAQEIQTASAFSWISTATSTLALASQGKINLAPLANVPVSLAFAGLGERVGRRTAEVAIANNIEDYNKVTEGQFNWSVGAIAAGAMLTIGAATLFTAAALPILGIGIIATGILALTAYTFGGMTEATKKDGKYNYLTAARETASALIDSVPQTVSESLEGAQTFTRQAVGTIQNLGSKAVKAGMNLPSATKNFVTKSIPNFVTKSIPRAWNGLMTGLGISKQMSEFKTSHDKWRDGLQAWGENNRKEIASKFDNFKASASRSTNMAYINTLEGAINILKPFDIFGASNTAMASEIPNDKRVENTKQYLGLKDPYKVKSNSELVKEDGLTEQEKLHVNQESSLRGFIDSFKQTFLDKWWKKIETRTSFLFSSISVGFQSTTAWIEDAARTGGQVLGWGKERLLPFWQRVKNGWNNRTFWREKPADSSGAGFDPYAKVRESLREGRREIRDFFGFPQLGGDKPELPGYPALNKLADLLATNPNYDTSTEKGAVAMAMGLLLGGYEVYYKGMDGDDFTTRRGGRSQAGKVNSMIGFLQINSDDEGHPDTTKYDTPQEYLNFGAGWLRGEMKTPNGQGTFNAQGLIDAIRSGTISTGAQFQAWLTSGNSGLDVNDWQSVFDGRGRAGNPDLAEHLVTFLQNNLKGGGAKPKKDQPELSKTLEQVLKNGGQIIDILNKDQKEHNEEAVKQKTMGMGGDGFVVTPMTTIPDGGGTAFHKDFMFHNATMPERVAMMDDMARGYLSIGKEMLAINRGVGGRKYSLTMTYEQKVDYINDLQHAHKYNRSNSSGRLALDFNLVDIGETRVNAVDKATGAYANYVIPTLPGGYYKVGPKTSDGQHLTAYDAQGRFVYETYHGGGMAPGTYQFAGSTTTPKTEKEKKKQKEEEEKKKIIYLKLGDPITPTMKTRIFEIVGATTPKQKEFVEDFVKQYNADLSPENHAKLQRILSGQEKDTYVKPKVTLENLPSASFGSTAAGGLSSGGVGASNLTRPFTDSELKAIKGDLLAKSGQDANFLKEAEKRGYKLTSMLRSEDKVKTKYVDGNGEAIYVHKDVSTAFEKMKAEAAKSGINLYIVSGYRSLEKQAQLLAKNKDKTDTQILEKQAPAGYSKHHTGIAIDINSTKASFANTPEAKWLEKHGSKFGFTLSYPKTGSKGANYEPWEYVYTGMGSSDSHDHGHDHKASSSKASPNLLPVPNIKPPSKPNIKLPSLPPPPNYTGPSVIPNPQAKPKTQKTNKNKKISFQYQQFNLTGKNLAHVSNYLKDLTTFTFNTAKVIKNLDDQVAEGLLDVAIATDKELETYQLIIKKEKELEVQIAKSTEIIKEVEKKNKEAVKVKLEGKAPIPAQINDPNQVHVAQKPKVAEVKTEQKGNTKTFKIDIYQPGQFVLENYYLVSGEKPQNEYVLNDPANYVA